MGIAQTAELTGNVDTAPQTAAVDQHPLQGGVFTLIADEKSAAAEAFIVVDDKPLRQNQRHGQQHEDNIKSADLPGIALRHIEVIDIDDAVENISSDTGNYQHPDQPVILDDPHPQPECPVNSGKTQCQHQRRNVGNYPDDMAMRRQKILAHDPRDQK